MRTFVIRLTVLTLLATPACVICAAADKDTGDETMEFIRVAADGWNFEKVPSGDRFVPFGANMIFNYPLHIGQGLHILTQEEWDPAVIRKVFEGARALNMNILKVFMTSNGALKSLQDNDKVAFVEMEPPFLDRLDYLFKVARDTDVYVSLTFAEWGCHSLKWWQDGGIFLGRGNEEDPDIDSYAVLGNFWRTLAERYRDEPALFSYNFAVEFYMPGGNWGGQRSGKEGYLLNDRWGLPAWHVWLKQQHGTLATVNERWQTEYAAFDEIPQPEINWVGEGDWRGHYTMPQVMIADYNSFKECVTYRFLKNQADAIRSVDTKHMITCGFHPHQPGIGWMGSARYTAGIACRELDFLDYVTTHLYSNPTDKVAGKAPPTWGGAISNARFMFADKPVIIEEMGHIVDDREETTRETINMVRNLAGHASGFVLWFLTDLKPDKPYGPLGLDLQPNAFGEEWKKLAEPGGILSRFPTQRIPARTTIHLDRVEGLAPISKTEFQTLLEHWDVFPQPVDFDWPGNPALDRMRKQQ